MKDKMDIERKGRRGAFEACLSLLSGLRKIPAKTAEDVAYNNALADAFDYIVKNESLSLYPNTVRQGKWVRDYMKQGLCNYECPKCGNEEIELGQNYCQICGEPIELGGFNSPTEEDIQNQMKTDPEWERKHKEQIKQATKDRENHIKSEQKPYKVPLLWIRDKSSGTTHLYGTDTHDSLWIDVDGINYYNLQNGDGTGKGGGYEFVNHDSEGMMDNQILHYYLESKEIW